MVHQIHDDGSGQCIPVILDEFLVQKVGNHYQDSRSLQSQVITSEHGIKSLSSILSKCLTNQGQMWHKLLSLATFTYKIFHTPNFGNYFPYELMFGRKPRILINIEKNPDIKISGTFKDYHTLLTKRLHYVQKMLQNFKMK